MKLLLLSNILLLLCLQAALAETVNQTMESESIEDIDDIMSELDKSGKISKTSLEKLKKFAETIRTNLTDLEEQYKDGEITIKKPTECKNKEEKKLHLLLRTYDKDNNGILSVSERNEMKELFVKWVIQLDNLMKACKDGFINIGADQESESEDIEGIDEEDIVKFFSKLDTNKTGKISKTLLEKVKNKTEYILTNLKHQEEQFKDGEITIKKPEECKNKEEEMIHEIFRSYDKGKNGKISVSELNKMKKVYVVLVSLMDHMMGEAGKDGQINIKDILGIDGAEEDEEN